MIFIFKIRNILVKHLLNLKWYSVLALIAGFIVASWFLMWVCGEADIADPNNFFYWLVVTGSTVGYGDLSPATSAGKLVVAFFIIPLSLGLFAIAVGQVATWFTYRWRRGIKGLKNLNVENHILVIGWNGQRTLQLLKLLLREQTHQVNEQAIVLCICSEVENPLPGKIGFVRVSQFTDEEGMARAGVAKAHSIIIDNTEDDVTLTTSLFCTSVNRHAHIIAHFKEESVGRLLKQHCPNIECTPSVSVEMMAKSAADPGSSMLHHQLLNVDKGTTQYSIIYGGSESVKVKSVFTMFKEAYQATLIGLRKNTQGDIELNPALDDLIEPDTTLYYISDERISSIDWEAAHV